MAVTDAEVLWVTEGIFLRLPPLVADMGEAFDAAQIFSADSGIPYVLVEVLNDPSLVGEEDIEGVPTYHITAQASGEDLRGLVGGAVAPGDAAVDLWVDTATSEVVRVAVAESDGNGWQLDLFGYGEPVDIPTP